MSRNFFGKFRINEYELKTYRKVFGVSGCRFMIRRVAIEKIGLLDKGTFLYEEENILGCQMEQIGYDVYLLPEVIVVHKHGQTSKYMRVVSFTYFVESEIYYCWKYLEGTIIEILLHNNGIVIRTGGRDVKNEFICKQGNVSMNRNL